MTRLDGLTAESAVQVDPPTTTAHHHMTASLRTAVVTRRKRSGAVLAAQIAVLALFLGTWEYLSRSGRLANADIFYGSPSGVVQKIWDDRGDLFTNLRATMYAALLGFLLGTVLAILVGVILGQVRMLDRIFDPFMVVLAGLPRIALAPLFVLWFGITDKAKIALSFSLVFFVVLFNMRAAVRSVDRDLLTVARVYGTSRRQTFFKVVLPSTIPVLFAGFRLALVFSILGVIASEMTASRDGLGLQVVGYTQTLQPNGVFAVLVVLAVTMAGLNAILQLIERRQLKWLPDEK